MAEYPRVSWLMLRALAYWASARGLWHWFGKQAWFVGNAFAFGVAKKLHIKMQVLLVALLADTIFEQASLLFRYT